MKTRKIVRKVSKINSCLNILPDGPLRNGLRDVGFDMIGQIKDSAQEDLMEIQSMIVSGTNIRHVLSEIKYLARKIG